MKDRKKRIAFILEVWQRGGAERVIANLAEYFFSQDYEVYVVTKLKEKVEYPLNDGIVRIVADITDEEMGKSRIGNLCARIRKLRSVWKTIRPDIIISFIRKNNVMALASTRGLNIPVVVSVEVIPKRIAGKSDESSFFFIVSICGWNCIADQTGKRLFPNNLQKKSIILPNSINPAFLTVQKELERDKEIVLVGRIDNNKNQRMLIEVFGDIAHEYPEWSVRLYGEGEDRKELEHLVMEKGIEHQVFFMGQVSNVSERIKKASIFVLPSRCEGMPNALIEAMTVGLAVISTDCPCGGPADLIQNGENGILIKVDDKTELRTALIKLMEDEAYRMLLSERASHISEKLHPDIVNEQWKSYIEGKLRKS